MLYVSVDPSLARVVPIMAIIPVAAAAWLLGFRVGVGAALVAFPTNALLELTWLDLSLLDIYSAPAMWLGHGGLLFVGGVFGLLRKGYDDANLQREALSETNIRLDDEIREHRLTEDRLRQAITNLESLVKASPAPIAALDREGRVLVWNPAAERVFGWKASEVIGKDNPIVPAEEEDESLNIWERLIAGESVNGIEVRRMRRDGSRIDLSISTAAWYDADDNVTGVVGVLIDLTEQRKGEQVMLEERKRMARDMHDGLAQILAYISAETAGISTLMESGKTDEVRREVDKLYGTAREMSSEIRQTILGLRISSSEPDQFADMFSEYVRDFAFKNGLKITFDGESVFESVRLPPSAYLQLVRIFQEALDNIRKHAGAESIHVVHALENGRLAITVEDDGVGFDAALNFSASVRHFGIQTMQERAESIGGSVEVESSPQAGTRVKVDVPA